MSVDLKHSKVKLLSLEQRREKQLLSLMHVYSKQIRVKDIPLRFTCSDSKFMFKIDSTKEETNINMEIVPSMVVLNH